MHSDLNYFLINQVSNIGLLYKKDDKLIDLFITE